MSAPEVSVPDVSALPLPSHEPSANPLPAPRLRLDYVDGARALAALMVVLNHSFGTAFLDAKGKMIAEAVRPLSFLLVYGHFSVSVFIVISGFCLMLPVVRAGGKLRDTLGQYIYRRARRIVPPYYCALAFSLAMIWLFIGTQTGTHWDLNIAFIPRDVLAHVLLVQNLFATGKINYVFWSIAVEWHIYFLFPVLIWLFRRMGMSWAVILALGAGYLMFHLHHRLERANTQYIGLFTMGMAAAWVGTASDERARRMRDRCSWTLVALAGALCVLTLTIYWGMGATKRFHIIDFPVGLTAFACLIIGARPGTNALRRALEWKPLVFVGTFSYSLYLIHAILLQLIWQRGLNPIGISGASGFWILTIAGVPLVVAGSYLFFLACERPFLNKPRATA